MAASRHMSARKLWRQLLTMLASFLIGVAIERLRQARRFRGKESRPLASYYGQRAYALTKLRSYEHASNDQSLLEGEHYTQQANRLT